jgi:hypothetical protein
MGGTLLVAIVVAIPLLVGLAVRSWWWALGCPGAVLVLGVLIAQSQSNAIGAGGFVSARAVVYILTIYGTLLVGTGSIVGTLVGTLIGFSRRRAA